MQLRFASFAVINLREDLHLQECAHAGRTIKKGSLGSLFLCVQGANSPLPIEWPQANSNTAMLSTWAVWANMLITPAATQR